LDLKLLFSIIAILSFAIFFVVHENFAFGQTDNSTTNNLPQGQSSDVLIINSNTKEGERGEAIRLSISALLFDVTPNYDQQGELASLSIKLKPELNDLYQTIGLFNKPPDTVFIYPSFTQAAYSNHGFYEYYHKTCDITCLTVPIPTKVVGFQSSSIAGAFVLKLLNYPYVKDEDIDKNPDILKQYKRVIVLHSEYVTKKEFDAITNHPDVIFLYPNALYAKVSVNYDSNTITLVRGHGYPDPSVRNGFGWKDDNSKYEYDVHCDNWTFYRSVDNYSMLNCYPEYKILSTSALLTELQISDPTELLNDTANWVRYHDVRDAQALLADYDINGTKIPQWVTNPAIMLLNSQITKSEFLKMLDYLYHSNIIQ